MDEIEVCANCGKMVPIREMSGTFTCPRCGSHSTMIVPLKDYEKVVQRLQEGKPPFEPENPRKKGTKTAKKTKKKKR